MADPTIDVVADVTTVLNTDETALNAQQTDLQSQIDALNAQIALLQAQVAALQAQKVANATQLANITLFRQLVERVTDNTAMGAGVIPAAPTLPTTQPAIV